MMRIAMIGRVLCLSALLAGPLIAAPATRPATRPSTHPSTRPTTRPEPASKPSRADETIRAAIVVLTREAQDATRKHGTFPRAEPNYFADKNLTLDSSELLKTLSKRISQDPRIDAYVKWQLLSGVPAFSAAQTKDAINAYVNASPMIPLPGMTEPERQRWVQAAQSAQTKDACDQVIQQWEAERAPYIAANASIIAYRDALRAKITPPEDQRVKVLQAEMEDLSQRAAAGLDTDEALVALTGELRAWATLAKRSEIGDMINFAHEYGRREGPKVNDLLVWYSTRKSATWRTRQAQLDPKKLDKLLEQLETAAKTAPQ